MRVIVTTMKNEGPFILEWIAHHLSIGFDHFIVNTNDCTDGTDQIILRLQEMGITTHIDNPGPWKSGPQKAAYDNAMAHPKLAEADWYLVSDADEFLNIKVGDGTLDDLFARCPDANLFSFTWQLFGNNGVIDFKDEFVTEQFTRAAHPYQTWPATCRALKTLCHKDAPFSIVSTHRPKKLAKDGVRKLRWVDGDGDDMGKYFARFGWQAANHGIGFGNDLARMHHYAVRSLDSYLMKRLRGDVRTTSYHHKMEETGFNYWILHCWNSVENESILKHMPRTRNVFEKLMNDAELNTLHNNAVAHHKDRIAALKALENAQNLSSRFRDHVEAYEFVPGHDIVICPDLALDTINFNPEIYPSLLKAARQNTVNLARKNRVLPWFTPADVTGIEFRSPKQEMQIGPLHFDVSDIKPVTFQTRPKRRKMRQDFLQTVRADSNPWALINSGDPELVEDILSAKNKSKSLFVFNAWGYRTMHPFVSMANRKRQAELMAQDMAYLDFIERFKIEIKAGEILIRRGDPYYALKMLPLEFFGTVFISGKLPFEQSYNLMRKTLSRLSKGGFLAVDSYHRRGSNGDSTLKAFHTVTGENAADVRLHSITGAHCALQTLEPEPFSDAALDKLGVINLTV